MGMANAWIFTPGTQQTQGGHGSSVNSIRTHKTREAMVVAAPADSHVAISASTQRLPAFVVSESTAITAETLASALLASGVTDSGSQPILFTTLRSAEIL